MLQQCNTKKQGDVGLGAAIAYFTKCGYTVCLPLTDSQDYDLVVDNGIRLWRVQVKTTSYVRNGNYNISLTVKGGNRSSIGKIKKMNINKVDAVFALTESGTQYFIPIEKLNTTSTLSLGIAYNDCIVGVDAVNGNGTCL